MEQQIHDTSQDIIDVWLDCDPGLDDCFGIILAVGHPRFNLLGVSTSAGNSTIENATKNASDLLSVIGRSDVPVYMGSRSPITKGVKQGMQSFGENGIGGITLLASKVAAYLENTFEMILQKIIGNKNKVAFVCTGALTNLSLLLKMTPLLKQKISIVSIMGGAIGQGNISPAAEFNIYFDPLAAQAVFSSGLNIVMVPLEVTHTALCDQNIRNKMRERKSPISKIFVDMILSFKQAYFNEQGFLEPPLHDPCAVFYLLQPHQFETKKAYVDVDLYPSSLGRTNIDFRSKKPNITVCVKMNVNRFWQQMMANYARIVPIE